MLKEAWTKMGHLIIVIGTAVLIYFIGTNDWGGNLQTAWYLMMAVMVLFILLLGLTTNDRLDGVLIDWRKKMTLSRLQVILWTIVGISAFLTVGLARIDTLTSYEYKLGDGISAKDYFEQAKSVDQVECLEDLSVDEITEDVLSLCPPPDPLQITFPEELLLAMGISIASFAGSALVKRSQSGIQLVTSDEVRQKRQEIFKKQSEKERVGMEAKLLNDKLMALNKEMASLDDPTAKEFKQVEVDATAKSLAEKNEMINNLDDEIKHIETETKDLESREKQSKGLLHVNQSTNQARWSDIFTKEISGEERLIDLSKLQMFFFTIAVIFAYGAELNAMMARPEWVYNPFGVLLPVFSSSLVVLLGISHGSYVAIKNTNTTATTTRNGR